jgi:hypothetical protein
MLQLSALHLQSRITFRKVVVGVKDALLTSLALFFSQRQPPTETISPLTVQYRVTNTLLESFASLLKEKGLLYWYRAILSHLL